METRMRQSGPDFGKRYMDLEDSHGTIIETCACTLLYLTILAAKNNVVDIVEQYR